MFVMRFVGALSAAYVRMVLVCDLGCKMPIGFEWWTRKKVSPSVVVSDVRPASPAGLWTACSGCSLAVCSAGAVVEWRRVDMRLWREIYRFVFKMRRGGYKNICRNRAEPHAVFGDVQHTWK